MQHVPLRRRLVTATLVATFAGTIAFAGAAQATTSGNAATSSARSTSAKVEKKVEKKNKKKKSGTKTINVRMFRFPDTTKVRVGTKVVWRNRDQILHTVSGVDDLSVIDGELDGAGAKVKVTFAEAGTYEYFCMIHPVMQGRIVVKG